METQYISLNMTPTGVNPCFHISQYDVGRMLGFIVHSGGATVDLDTYTCTIEATRSDGTAITSAVATTDNIGTFEVTPTMSNKADKYRCQLIIVDENSKRIASLPFDMEVTKAAMDEDSESIEEDASLYQQYTGAVKSAIADINADMQTEKTSRATTDASLQAQINQLVAPSGEAPSAAEVQNARIGADGVTYPTLGEAIRGQVTDLKSALNDTKRYSDYIFKYNFSSATDIIPDVVLGNTVEIAIDMANNGASTCVLYKTSSYSSSEPTNIRLWDNVYGLISKSVTFNENYKIHIWKNNSVDAILSITHIGEISKKAIKSIEEDGIKVESVTASNNAESYNNISNLKAGKYYKAVCDAQHINMTVRIDSNSSYDANSGDIIVLFDGVTDYHSESKIIYLPKDYKSIRTYNNSNNPITIDFYEISEINALTIGAIEYVRPTYINYAFDGDGNTGSIYHDYCISTEKLERKGLYIVTFPDDVKVTYNVKNQVGLRENDENYAPISYINNDFFRVRFDRKNGGAISPSDDVVKNISIYRIITNENGINISVAASDSVKTDKNKANIIVDGSNDTEILCALFGCYHSINVLLYGGNYNIAKAWTYSDTAKCSVSLIDNNFDGSGYKYRRYINVFGDMPCTPQSKSVNLVVSSALHNSLDNAINNFIIASPYSITSGEIGRISISCNFKNFNVIGYSYNKAVTYIDTTRCLSTMLESVNVRSWATNLYEYLPFNDTPNAKCVGIRVGRGSNYGIQNYVKHLNVWYCGIGIACNGEHFVFEDVKVHHDYIGFYIGDKKTVGQLEHPNIFIGCSIEACYRLMVLSKAGVTVEQDFVYDYASKIVQSTIVMIGTSTEQTWEIPVNERVEGQPTEIRTLPILEIIRGCYRGRIEMDGGRYAEGSCPNVVLTAYN